MERDEFLARVRAATTSGAVPAAAAPPPPPWPDDDLVALFTRRAVAAHAVVHRVSDVAGAAEAAAAIAAGHEGGAYVAWETDPLVEVLVDACRKAGMHGVDDPAAASLGITGAAVAIAESGSVVVTSGPARPRATSLLPTEHLVVLDAGRIVRALADALATVPPSDTANWVAITGPSRTADIEQHLNLGVHGPRAVHIIVVDPAAARRGSV